MMQSDSIEERVRRLAFDGPNPELRGRVLAAAAPHVRPGVTWSDRVWFSRRWRCGTVALLFAIAALERISVAPDFPASEPGTAAMQAEHVAQEAARQAGLPSDEADALVRRALAATMRPAVRSELSIDPETGEFR